VAAVQEPGHCPLEDLAEAAQSLRGPDAFAGEAMADGRLAVTHEDRAYERRVQLTEQVARTETSPIRQVLGFSRKTWYRLDEEVRTIGVRRHEGAASHILCTAEPPTAALPSVGCTLPQIRKHPRRRIGTGLTTKRHHLDADVSPRPVSRRGTARL
jgi:hypothetical protein